MLSQNIICIAVRFLDTACQITTVVMGTVQLVLSQFKNCLM